MAPTDEIGGMKQEAARLMPSSAPVAVCGHLLNCGRHGWRAFDREGRPVDYFPTQARRLRRCYVALNNRAAR
jgi:hypothetical protein